MRPPTPSGAAPSRPGIPSGVAAPCTTEINTLTEFHKRSDQSRKRQKSQIEKHFENRRKPEDHKRLKEQARKRKNARRASAPRRHDWKDERGDLATSERMTRPRPADAPKADASTLTPEAARVGHDDPVTTHDSPRTVEATGVVISVGRGCAGVALASGVVDAQLAPDIAAVQQTELAVGDEVSVSLRGEVARVESVATRRTTLSRPDPGNAHRHRVLAANIDIAVLVLSVRRPTFRPGLVDRFLVALDAGGVMPAIVANKADLLEDTAARADILEALAPQMALGISAILVSAETGEGLHALRSLVRGRRSVFVGHSGVGKSSLLNALDPDGARLTHAGREGDGKGRHTTTHSTLTSLPDSTEVIDTPGVRAFGLWHMDRAALRDAFPDLAAHAPGCRFRDCSHLVEPDCAVRTAVDRGEVAASRFASYLRIHASLDE
jgi:ribosome biogenesis GTPase